MKGGQSPIEAEIVKDGAGPDFAYLPPTRTQRVARWLSAREWAMLIVTIALMLVFSIPLRWFGWSYVAVAAALFVGFLAGWACARRYWLRDGIVPKL